MKAVLSTFVILLAFIQVGFAQDAMKDLDISGKDHVNSLIMKGKFRLWAKITNKSATLDYKDITYRVTFLGADGTEIWNKDLVLYDFVGHGTTKKIKEQYLDCPKECKDIALSIVSGTSLHH